MQQTIAGRAVVTGVGYWSGAEVRLEFRPAPADSGVVFVRSDLGRTARVPALVENRVDVPRRTNLAVGDVEVHMVEHVLAALAGLEIDNCEVWANRPEMPGCDGSSAPFVDALLAAGIKEQLAVAERLEVTETVRVVDGETWIEASPSSDSRLALEFQLDYPRFPAIGRQTAVVALTPDSFQAELAPCRTFLLQSEADQLRAAGLGTHVTSSDLLLFGDEGPIANPLRFPNECARHKALDVLGDLALAGKRIAGRVVAHRSGHRLHAELTKILVRRFAPQLLQASA